MWLDFGREIGIWWGPLLLSLVGVMFCSFLGVGFDPLV